MQARPENPPISVRKWPYLLVWPESSGSTTLHPCWSGPCHTRCGWGRCWCWWGLWNWFGGWGEMMIKTHTVETAYRITKTKPGPHWHGKRINPFAVLAVMRGHRTRPHIKTWCITHSSHAYVIGFDCGWNLTKTVLLNPTNAWLEGYMSGRRLRQHFIGSANDWPLPWKPLEPCTAEMFDEEYADFEAWMEKRKLELQSRGTIAFAKRLADRLLRKARGVR